MINSIHLLTRNDHTANEFWNETALSPNFIIEQIYENGYTKFPIGNIPTGDNKISVTFSEIVSKAFI